MKSIFFARNLREAKRHIRDLAKRDNFYKRVKKIRLFKKQIQHIENWKTYEIIFKKTKRG